MQIYYRDYQLSKMVDEEEICKSFLRQSEFRGKEIDDMEVVGSFLYNNIQKASLAKILKADVDEAWRRKQEELRGRNRNEIREEFRYMIFHHDYLFYFRWLKAVQDSDHTRKIKARRAEQRRQELEERWGRHRPAEEPKLE